MKGIRIPKILLIICFCLQVVLWFYSNRVKPSFIITPYPPTAREIQALSFGDVQFFYRNLAFKLQNAGDKYGHYTNINNYDYHKLVRWFDALDDIDIHSQYIPFMAAYYYSMVQDDKKSLLVADYIFQYAKANPQQNWRLLTTASYIYNKHTSEYSKTQLQKIGNILITTEEIPFWPKTLAAFYLQDQGDICSAYNLISLISKDDMIEAKENAQDPFLMKILEENINKLKNISRVDVVNCINYGS